MKPTTAEALFHVRSTVCCVGAVPVPVRLSEGEFEALLVKEPFAEALPAAWGEKVSVNGTLCPAAIVSGKVIPLSENSELLMLTDDMATLAVVAVSMPF